MKIKSINIANERELYIELNDGEIRVFNISKYLDGEVFKPLGNKEELQKFTLEYGCIEWECGASLSEDTLLAKSVSKTLLANRN